MLQIYQYIVVYQATHPCRESALGNARPHASAGLGKFGAYSPPGVDRIWSIWGSYCNIPNAIFDP